MKLIDTDVLFAQMKEYHEKRVEEANMTGNRTVCVTWQDAIILIKNTPIVDAVPVEWIRKYTKENRLYQSDDFDFYIDDMIADWRERKEE